MMPCLACGVLTMNSRCTTCATRRHDPYRDPAYRRNRLAVLAGSPRCALRLVCDGARATTVDHVISLARGGSSAITNLQPACVACNSSKRRGGRQR